MYDLINITKIHKTDKYIYIYIYIYIFVGVIEISVYLQFIKSKKYHRQKALHATPTLYCACRLVVPSGNENT